MKILEKNECVYCGTEYEIHFERDDDELMYCPSCGEQIPDEEELEYEELDFDED